MNAIAVSGLITSKVRARSSPPPHAGHDRIGQQQVNVAWKKFLPLHGFYAITGFEKRMAQLGRNRAHQRTHRLLVIHYQDRSLGAGLAVGRGRRGIGQSGLGWTFDAQRQVDREGGSLADADDVDEVPCVLDDAIGDRLKVGSSMPVPVS